MLAFVVAYAARINSAVADRRLERRRDPGLQRLGRLHVIMAVEQDGRRPGDRARAGQHHRVAFCRHGLRHEAEIGQHVDEQSGDLADALVLRADAWMTDIVHQPLDEAVSVGLDVREDGGEVSVGGCHSYDSTSASGKHAICESNRFAR